MVTESAQRCPAVGASVDADLTVVIEKGGLAAGVAAGGKKVLTESAQRCAAVGARCRFDCGGREGGAGSGCGSGRDDDGHRECA
jgi:hypothetical protein